MTVNTTYDDDADTFITVGHAQLKAPLGMLSRVAADFGGYGRWALRKINVKASGKPFIIKLKSVKHRPGPPVGEGHFSVGYDVDLIWPFGRQNQVIDFGIVEAPRRSDGGIEHLRITLHGTNRFIKRFEVRISAAAAGGGSRIHFKAKVKLNGFIDTFFPLSVYRRNIEYRVVKVIANLRYFLDERLSPSPTIPPKPRPSH